MSEEKGEPVKDDSKEDEDPEEKEEGEGEGEGIFLVHIFLSMLILHVLKYTFDSFSFFIHISLVRHRERKIAQY